MVMLSYYIMLTKKSIVLQPGRAFAFSRPVIEKIPEPHLAQGFNSSTYLLGINNRHMLT